MQKYFILCRTNLNTNKKITQENIDKTDWSKKNRTIIFTTYYLYRRVSFVVHSGYHLQRNCGCSAIALASCLHPQVALSSIFDSLFRASPLRLPMFIFQFSIFGFTSSNNPEALYRRRNKCKTLCVKSQKRNFCSHPETCSRM